MKFLTLRNALFGLGLASASLLMWSSCQNQSQATPSSTAVATPAPTPPSVPVVAPTPDSKKLDSNARFVYLTFDDGPLGGSDALNQIILEKQTKATVFVVAKHTKGKNSNKMFQDFKANPYLEVDNHSYTHANNRYQAFYAREGGDFAARDVMQCEQELGLTHKIVRLPGRDSWILPNRERLEKSGTSTARILKSNGYRLYGWDVEWRRSKSGAPLETAEELVEQIDNAFRRGSKAMFTKNHLVVLAHDPMFLTKGGQESLRSLLDLINKRGYICEYMSRYPDEKIFN
jgi:peptidoglycan/xylan/chitin deacetylase (PgdA/CDA1 family)